MLRASSLKVKFRAEERSGSVAATSPIANTPSTPGTAQVETRLHVAVLVEDLGGQPAGVGPGPPDRPQHRVRLISACPVLHATGSSVIRSHPKPGGTTAR